MLLLYTIPRLLGAFALELSKTISKTFRTTGERHFCLAATFCILPMTYGAIWKMPLHSCHILHCDCVQHELNNGSSWSSCHVEPQREVRAPPVARSSAHSSCWSPAPTTSAATSATSATSAAGLWPRGGCGTWPGSWKRLAGRWRRAPQSQRGGGRSPRRAKKVLLVRGRPDGTFKLTSSSSSSNLCDCQKKTPLFYVYVNTHLFLAKKKKKQFTGVLPPSLRKLQQTRMQEPPRTLFFQHRSSTLGAEGGSSTS